MSGPERMNLGLQPGETQEAWRQRRFGRVPREVEPDPVRPSPGAVYLERTIPPAYRWARFDAGELGERVPKAALEQAGAASAESRVCLMGIARAGKTSLGVAMLRAWVARTRRPAAFVHAYRLGVARIQHPAGQGEPEAVDVAMRMPLILLDDLGSERDHAFSAVPDVIFERDAQSLPTWVTTGLTREQLVKRYGLGVVARVFERAKVIHVGGRTQRL
jgi:DNA replication protein DnaC